MPHLENLHYKINITLFIILFLINICHGSNGCSSCSSICNLNLPVTSIYSFYSQRYINDLGNEWPIESFIGGIYWKGGAWGSKNGLSNYYGNIYYNYYEDIYHHYYEVYSYPETIYRAIPEPSSLILLTSFIFLYRKKLLKSD